MEINTNVDLVLPGRGRLIIYFKKGEWFIYRSEKRFVSNNSRHLLKVLRNNNIQYKHFKCLFKHYVLSLYEHRESKTINDYYIVC